MKWFLPLLLSCSLYAVQMKGLVLVDTEQALLPPHELIQVEGLCTYNLAIPREDLQACLDPIYLGKSLCEETIADLRNTICTYYARRGFPFVLVTVPDQSIACSVLQLVVTEAELGNVSIQGNCYVSERRLCSYLHLFPNEPIHEQRLTRDLNFINRNPFRRVDAIYSVGQLCGETDVLLNVCDRRPLRAYVGSNNNGVDTTGRELWFVGVNWGNAFWLDHILTYQFTGSTRVRRLQSHTLQYIAPLPRWQHLLLVYGGYARVRAPLSVPTLRTRGYSAQASGRYQIPMSPYSRYFQHDVLFGFDWKRTNNTIEFTNRIPIIGNNVNLSQFAFEYRGSYNTDCQRWDWNGGMYYSPGRIMNDQTNADFASLRPRATNYWVYFRGEVACLRRLPGDFSTFVSLRFQLSPMNLIPSEQFSLGGMNTVRGYQPRAVNAEQGLLANFEFRTPALCRGCWGAFQLLGFVDYGVGRNTSPIGIGIPLEQQVLGIGPGFRYTLDPYITARCDLGTKCVRRDRYGGGRNMIYFSATASY